MNTDSFDPKINKQIAIYARVSSVNQENEGTIETQLSAVYDYIKKKNYTIIQEYLDNGWSGDNIARPELDRLRVDARKKLFQAVVIYDPDRLARRYSYQELISDELREAGIEVEFVTTPAPTNGIEKILFGVQGLFAEYERAKITERFRLGKVRKANEGNIILSEAPYGYKFIPKQGTKGEESFRQGYIEIDPREAEIVKSIFEWVAEGMTIRKVVRRLQELQIPPRKSKRGVWSTSTLSSLLRNKTYIGEAHFGASYAVAPLNPIKKEAYKKNKKSSRRAKPESEWIKIPVPSLIDKSLFDQVQGNLRLNFEFAKRNTKNEYLLSRKIWCTCGQRRAGEGAISGKYLYYRCTGRVYSFPLPCSCKEKGINAIKTDAIIWNIVSHILNNPELLKEKAGEWLKRVKPKEGTLSGNAELIKAEISKLKEQEDRLTRAFGEGIITIDTFKTYIEPIRSKISLLNKQISDIGVSIKPEEKPLIIDSKYIDRFAYKAAQSLESLPFEVKKGIISNIIERVEVSSKQIKILGAIPSDYLRNVQLFTSHRNRANTMPQNVSGSIRFEISTQSPPSLKRGVDYGFRPVKK